MAATRAAIATNLKMFDAAPVGVAVTSGPDHTLIYTNPTYRSIFGDRQQGLTVREGFQDLEDLDRYLATFDWVAETGESITATDTLLTMRFAGDTERNQKWFSFSLSPITIADRGRGVLVIAAEVTDRVLQAERITALAEERRRIRARFRTLGRVGAQVVVVSDPDGQVIEPSPGWEEVTGQSFEQFRGDGWLQAVHPTDRVPVRAAWIKATTEAPAVWDSRFRLRTVSRGYRRFKLHAVPVYDEDKLVEWVTVCADVEEEYQRERRTRLLDRAAATTSGVREVDEILTALAHVVVPTLTDSCRVYVPRETSTHPDEAFVDVDRVATVMRPGLAPFLDRINEQRGSQTMLGRAIREWRPSAIAFEPGSPPPEAGPDHVRAWLSASDANSLVCIPIIVDGTVAAAASMTGCADRPPPDDADIALMTQIFEHAHDALSSAIAYRRSRMIAVAMQHSLLTSPPEVPGLEITARYQPSSSTSEVGGDWYDCFLLPDGTTVMSIGDVAGHDLPAAVAMGQVRTILRGLAVEPAVHSGAILQRLNTAIETLYGNYTATCILARVAETADSERVLNYSVAGHPPPLLVTADGESRFLEAGRNPLLGIPRDEVFEYSDEPLPPGCTVLLYTDGLVEHPDEHIDEGLERLRLQAASLALEPVELFCDKLLSGMPLTRRDDIALIALRVPGEVPQ